MYAFGVITWEIYVGRRAWEGMKPTEVLKKVAARARLEFPKQTPHRLKVRGLRQPKPQGPALVGQHRLHDSIPHTQQYQQQVSSCQCGCLPQVLGDRCMEYDPALRPTFNEVLKEVNSILNDTMGILQQFLAASTAANAAPRPAASKSRAQVQKGDFTV